MRTMMARLKSLGPAVLIAFWVVGCSQQDPSIIAEMDGWSLSIDELRGHFERLYPRMPYEDSSCDSRQKLLHDLVHNELLLGMAHKQVDELSWPMARRIRNEREKLLVDGFFQNLWGSFAIDAEQHEEVLGKLSREVHLQRIVFPRIGKADSCYAEIAAGLAFEAAYKKYQPKVEARSTAFDMGWVSPETLPHKVVRKVFLQDAQVNQVITPTHTVRGIVVMKVLGFRSQTFRPSQVEPIQQMLRVLCYRDTLRVKSERLQEKEGFKVFEENFPVVNRCFNTYWDSLRLEHPQANRIAMLSYRSPLWNLGPEERDVPIYELGGRIGTAEDFLESLNNCDVEFWPGGPTREHRAREIKGRLERLMIEQEALRLGRAELPEVRAKLARLEDEAYLDDFFNRIIAPTITVTPEEARAELEGNPNGYRIHERAAFTIMRFPPYARETALAFRAEHKDDTARDWALAGRAAADVDTNIVFEKDEGVIDLELPPQDIRLRPLVPEIAKLETHEVSELIELPEGFALIRCNYRRHPEPLPEASALPLAEGEVRRQKVDRKVEELLAAARRARRVREYPERLCEPGPAAQGSE